VASLLWGTAPIAGKVALAGITAPVLSTLRLLAGGIFLAVYLRRRDPALFHRPPRLVYPAALGLAANYVGFMWGVDWAGAATAHVLIQLAPLFLLLLGIVLFKERLTARQATGATVAFAGVFLVTRSPADPAAAPAPLAGILAAILGALAWGGYAAAQKALGNRHPSGRTMMWILLLAAAMSTPLSLVQESRTPGTVQVIAILYLCANTIAAYWSFAEALRHIEASVAAVLTTLGPVVSFSLLWLADVCDSRYLPRERLDALKLAGAALVITGVATAVAVRVRRRRGPARPV